MNSWPCLIPSSIRLKIWNTNNWIPALSLSFQKMKKPRMSEASIFKAVINPLMQSQENPFEELRYAQTWKWIWDSFQISEWRHKNWQSLDSLRRFEIRFSFSSLCQWCHSAQLWFFFCLIWFELWITILNELITNSYHLRNVREEVWIYSKSWLDRSFLIGETWIWAWEPHFYSCLVIQRLLVRNDWTSLVR